MNPLHPELINFYCSLVAHFVKEIKAGFTTATRPMIATPDDQQKPSEDIKTKYQNELKDVSLKLNAINEAFLRLNENVTQSENTMPQMVVPLAITTMPFDSNSFKNLKTGTNPH